MFVFSPVKASITESFHVGQVVKCRVKKIDLEKSRVYLTFYMANKPAKQPREKVIKGTEIAFGDIVEGVVIAKNQDGIRFTLSPSGAMAFLMTSHLSDQATLCPQIHEAVADGATLSGLLALFRDPKGILVSCAFVFLRHFSLLRLTSSFLRISQYVTNKQSLITASKANELPDSPTKISVGKVYSGFVRSITEYGCFIAFLGETVGLSLKKELTDAPFVRPISEVFSLGQSVRAHILEVSLEENKVTSTLSFPLPLSSEPNSSFFLLV